MIRDLTISHLRGLRSAAIEGLTGLTILTGPNGSGKSTVLDALALYADPDPARALVHVVPRRPMVPRCWRYLVHRDAKEGRAVLSSTLGMVGIQVATDAVHWQTLDSDGQPTALVTTVWSDATPRAPQVWERPRHPFSPMTAAALIDTGLPVPLAPLYSDAVRAGGKGAVLGFLRAILPHVQDMEILVEGDIPVLHLVTDEGAVPANLAGDGVPAMLTLAFRLAEARSGSLFLIEEPETCLHPAAIQQVAAALAVAARRGAQVVLTTHSLELIDALVAVPDLGDLLSLQVLRLRQGTLKAVRWTGEEIRLARTTIEQDLR